MKCHQLFEPHCLLHSSQPFSDYASLHLLHISSQCFMSLSQCYFEDLAFCAAQKKISRQKQMSSNDIGHIKFTWQTFCSQTVVAVPLLVWMFFFFHKWQHSMYSHKKDIFNGKKISALLIVHSLCESMRHVIIQATHDLLYYLSAKFN